jgi:hypothetical protein
MRRLTSSLARRQSQAEKYEKRTAGPGQVSQGPWMIDEKSTNPRGGHG